MKLQKRKIIKEILDYYIEIIKGGNYYGKVQMGKDKKKIFWQVLKIRKNI